MNLITSGIQNLEGTFKLNGGMVQGSKKKDFVLFKPLNRKVYLDGPNASLELSLLELALRSDVEIDHSCGGMGSCGTCRVRIESDEPLPERNDTEIEIAKDRDFATDERLACQLCPKAGWTVIVPQK